MTAFKTEVKKCTPCLISQSVVGQFTPRWQGLRSMRTANKEKPISHNLYSFTSNYVMPC